MGATDASTVLCLPRDNFAGARAEHLGPQAALAVHLTVLANGLQPFLREFYIRQNPKNFRGFPDTEKDEMQTGKTQEPRC